MDTANLYVHIGTHKTGSTAIQSFLRHHQMELKRKGLVYISLHDGYEALMKATQVDEDVVNGLRKNLSCQIGKNFAQSNVSYVASWEGFSGDPVSGYDNAAFVASHLKRCLGDIPVKIIVYLRRQDSFLGSLYTQKIHEGESYTFEHFSNLIPPLAFDWRKLLMAYSDQFGRGNIVVKRYDKAYLPSSFSLLNGFFEIIGIDIEDILSSKKPPNPNKGYSRDALEIARLCNPELSDRDQKRLRRILQKTSSKQPFEKYTYMTGEDRMAFMKPYESSNKAIAEQYLDDPSGELFPTPSATTIGATQHEMDTEAIIPELVSALLSDNRNPRDTLKQFLQHSLGPAVKGLYRKSPGIMYKIRETAHNLGFK